MVRAADHPAHEPFSGTTVFATSRHSQGNGVNDAGTVVGFFSSGAAMHGAIWRPGEARIDIPPLAGHVHTAANDINNDGVVVGTAFGATSILQNKGWIRLTDGRIFELAPSGNDIGSMASAVTDAVNGQVIVVGTTTSPVGGRRGIRWTFQLATGNITSEVLEALTDVFGVTSSGAVAGTTTTQAILLRNGVSLSLGVQGSNPQATGVAAAPAGPVYVSGYVGIPGSAAAVRWRVQ